MTKYTPRNFSAFPFPHRADRCLNVIPHAEWMPIHLLILRPVRSVECCSLRARLNALRLFAKSIALLNKLALSLVESLAACRAFVSVPTPDWRVRRELVWQILLPVIFDPFAWCKNWLSLARSALVFDALGNDAAG